MDFSLVETLKSFGFDDFYFLDSHTDIMNVLLRIAPTLIERLIQINETYLSVSWLIPLLVIFGVAVIAKTSFKQRRCKPPCQDVKTFKQMYINRVHKICEDPNPSKDNIKSCIRTLNQFPSLINRPIDSSKETPFLRACSAGNVPLVRFMLKKGAYINSTTAKNESPMYLAVMRTIRYKKWNPSLIDLLYKAGCNLSTMTVNGYTPLHLAVHAGHVSLTVWLLIRNAHVSMCDMNMKVSPYDIAVQYSDQAHMSIAALLHTYCPEMAAKKANGFSLSSLSPKS